MRRHWRGVIEAADVIHGHVAGTGDSLTVESFDAVVEWLEWRVSDIAWLASPSYYDECVRNLAGAAIREARGQDEVYVARPDDASERCGL